MKEEFPAEDVLTSRDVASLPPCFRDTTTAFLVAKGMSSAVLSREIWMAKNEISPRPSEPFVNELVERCMYMERILKHKIPQLDLSTRSLQQESQTLAAANISRHENIEGSASQDEGDVEIEDEQCTIDPITDNVARE